MRDLQDAIDYYKEKAENLGYRFADLVDGYFERIASVPTAFAIRYKDIRCKPMATFPYLIMYTVDEVNVLRVFSTYKEPLW